MEHTLYHSLLRVSAVVCAFVLLFDSGLVLNDSARLSDGTQAYLANVVNVSATIPPNELNVITAQLTEQQLALDARERAITEREIELQQNPTASPGTDTSTFVLSAILFILLVLIVLNYGLDYARVRKQMTYAANA